MSVEALEGTTYGPYTYRTCRDKIAEYLDATSDDPDRWADAAPPSFAGALLFVVAPHLLSDPEAEEDSASLIHGDQSFVWHRSIPAEEDLQVSGTVSRVRRRGGVAYVAFELDVTMENGPVLEGTSTFLMSGERPPGGGAAEDDEPAPAEGSIAEPVQREIMPAPGEPLPPLHRGASRTDLVRYAGASRDWNPVHWDHRSAVTAGLPGVVVHGLLQSAWICQAATRFSAGSRPLERSRFRFRSPLRPAVATSVGGTVKDATTLDMAIESDDTTFATAVVSLAS